MRISSFAALLLLPLVTAACGSDSPSGNTQPQFGSVSGSVTAAGAGVSGATLELSRAGSSSRSATTNASGDFQITQVETGTWTLTVTLPEGFDIVGSNSTSVTVAANQTTTADFQAEEGEPSGEVETIIIRDNGFDPDEKTISVGDRIRWRNEGALDHNSTGAGGAWTSPNIPPNGTYERPFNTAGEFEYTCTLHPDMTGTIIVQ